MHPTLRAGVLAAVAAAAAVAIPGPADADTDSCEVALWHTDQALQLVTVDLPKPWTLIVECGTPPHAGHADPATSTVTVWPETLSSVGDIAWMILHEMGHAYDEVLLGDIDREWWMWQRDLDGPWWQYSGTDVDYDTWSATPAEDWAEAFAFCVSGDADGWVRLHRAPPTVQDCGLVQHLTGVPVA